jgi:hypothetical protein
VIAALEHTLDSKDPTECTSAALALVRLGRRDAKTVEILAADRGNGGPLVSVRAAEGLLLLDRDAENAWSALVSTLTADPIGFGGGEEAADALGRLAAAGKALPHDALAAIQWATTVVSPEVRRAAIAARARIPMK